MKRSLALLLCLTLVGCSTPPPEPLSRIDRSRAAPSVTAPVSAVRNVEPWEFAGTQGQTIRTDHYRIFTTATRPILVKRLPGF
ncbi:MAG: hypothetical protein AAFY46_08550, partial [Planctomycetota bacterium]